MVLLTLDQLVLDGSVSHLLQDVSSRVRPLIFDVEKHVSGLLGFLPTIVANVAIMALMLLAAVIRFWLCSSII